MQEIISMLMSGMLILAVVNFIFLLIKDRDALRFDLQAIINFGGFLVILGLIRLAVRYNSPIETYGFDPSGMLIVFWEDLAFGASLYIFEKYISSKKRYFIPFAIIISLICALGHLYQGTLAAAMTIFIPYFGFKKYAEKYGFGTTGLCHICYDISTIAVFKLIVLLKYVR